MSLDSALNRNAYVGNGTVDTYDYDFRIFAQTDLVVVVRDLNDQETTLTIGTHYTVSGVGDADGGSVALVNGVFDWIDGDGDLKTNYILSIRRVRPLTQETDIRNQGEFFPEIHEDAFDNFVMIDQQQQEEIDRSFKLSQTTSDVDPTLPNPSAGLALGWNQDEDAIVNIALPGTVAISNFMESLLDDTTAAAARTTLDAAQQVASVSAAVPEIGDKGGFIDISASNAEKNALLGAIAQAMLSPGWAANLGFAAATTTNANDSIKIQGAAAALSATNPLYVNLPSTTAGLVSRFNATANVTILLTGAHWGMGTYGDLTAKQLVVYAINDNGTLKWGVSKNPALTSIADSASSITPTSVTTHSKMLVNSALSSGTWPCFAVGIIKANFDDTGGAAEDLWAVQTSAGMLLPNVAVSPADQVVAVYETDTARSIANNSANIGEFLCELKVEDTHGALNPSTGIFTCQKSMDHEVSAAIQIASTTQFDVAEIVEFHVYKNGSLNRVMGTWVSQVASANISVSINGTTTIPCVAGDTLEVRVRQNSSIALSCTSSKSENNWVSYKTVGN